MGTLLICNFPANLRLCQSQKCLNYVFSVFQVLSGKFLGFGGEHSQAWLHPIFVTPLLVDYSLLSSGFLC